MDSTDVAIVGGGVMGASAAFWLTRLAPGLRVAVLERDPTYARAATALSLASIRAQFSTEANVRISRFGIEFIRSIAEWTGSAGGVSDLGFQENGYLFVTPDPASAAVMEELASMQRALGAGTEVLDRRGLAARFPWLNTDDLVAGSFGVRDEGWFDNMGLLAALRGAARAAGARFFTADVTGITVVSGHATGVSLASGDQISAGTVIVAAGTRAPALLAAIGCPVPVEPRKRTVFVLDAPNAPPPSAPLLIDRDFYVRPERGQWLTATVPANDGPCDPDDFEPDLDLFETVIWPALWHRVPGFDAVRVRRHWVGHYDFNRLDQNAILGPHPAAAGLLLCSGFSGHGLQQAPAVGRGLAELVLHGAWQTLDLSSFSVERVLAGRPIVERAVV